MNKVKAIKGYSLFPKKEFTLVTTNTEFDYNDYVQWAMDCNDGEYEGEDSEHFHNWCEDEAQMNIECDMSNLRYLSKFLGGKFVVEGWMGLWWGHPEVIPVVFDNLADAVEKCIGECDYFDVKWNNGIVEVSASHHDGTNLFEISALSAHGLRKFERCEDNCEMFHPNADDKKRIPYPYHLAV